MADIIEEQVVETIDPKVELANAMALALGTAHPAEPVAATQPTLDPALPTEPTPFTFDPFKEKFGYQSPEDAIKEIEDLRAYKDTPATPTYEFENEESKKLFEALAAGKRKEVFDYLNKQQRIDELTSVDVTKDNAADVVKYAMQLKYPNLTQAEVEYKYRKQFNVPPKPAQAQDEEDDDYQKKVAAWQEVVEDRHMELMIEAKTARPEIEAAKAKLVLPEIDQQVDSDYLNYKKAIEDEQKIAAETVKVYKAFTPKAIETK